MRRKLPRYIVIPVILLIYLAVMSYIGYPFYKKGIYSPAYYFGIIAASLAVDILLFFFLRKRDQLRRKRESETQK